MTASEMTDHLPSAVARLCFAALAAFAAVALVWADAHAQGCCTVGDNAEFGVVGRSHQAVLGGQVAFEPSVGTYDADGNFRFFEDADFNDLVVTLGGGTRFGTDRFQGYATLPVRLQHRGFGGEAAYGWGVGDANLGIRHTVLEDRRDGIDLADPGTYAPFLDVYAHGRLPTGRAPDSTNNPSGADVTGSGHWGITAGMRASKFVNSRHVLGAYAEVERLFARQIQRRDTTVAYRPGTDAGVGVNYLHLTSGDWSWGLDAGVRLGLPARENGHAIPDSATRRVQLGAHLTRHLHFPLWEVTLSASNDAWGDVVGKNLPFVGPSIALSVQRNIL